MICKNCKAVIPPEEIAKEFAAMGGKKTSRAKKEASAANGKKGGRPKSRLSEARKKRHLKKGKT